MMMVMMMMVVMSFSSTMIHDLAFVAHEDIIDGWGAPCRVTCLVESDVVCFAPLAVDPLETKPVANLMSCAMEALSDLFIVHERNAALAEVAVEAEPRGERPTLLVPRAVVDEAHHCLRRHRVHCALKGHCVGARGVSLHRAHGL